eukprot:jgi/Chlat1/5906/Chrsp4S06246
MTTVNLVLGFRGVERLARVVLAPGPNGEQPVVEPAAVLLAFREAFADVPDLPGDGDLLLRHGFDMSHDIKTHQGQHHIYVEEVQVRAQNNKTFWQLLHAYRPCGSVAQPGHSPSPGDDTVEESKKRPRDNRITSHQLNRFLREKGIEPPKYTPQVEKNLVHLNKLAEAVISAGGIVKVEEERLWETTVLRELGFKDIQDGEELQKCVKKLKKLYEKYLGGSGFVEAVIRQRVDDPDGTLAVAATRATAMVAGQRPHVDQPGPVRVPTTAVPSSNGAMSYESLIQERDAERRGREQAQNELAQLKNAIMSFRAATAYLDPSTQNKLLKGRQQMQADAAEKAKLAMAYDAIDMTLSEEERPYLYSWLASRPDTAAMLVAANAVISTRGYVQRMKSLAHRQRD